MLSPHAECKKRHGEKEGDEGVMNMLLQKASQSRTSKRMAAQGLVFAGMGYKVKRLSGIRPKAVQHTNNRKKSEASVLVQPPRVSSVSLRLRRMQVKMGVSRRVYRDPSVSRSAITKSRKSSGLSLSNATTHS